MASPNVLAMLLTTKYVDCLPLHRFAINEPETSTKKIPKSNNDIY